jgi:hypothetical protein
MFALRPGEVVEVYQGAANLLLARAPHDAIATAAPGPSRLSLLARRIEVTVAVVRDARVAGSLVFAMPVAAEAIKGFTRDQLADALHASEPSLVID